MEVPPIRTVKTAGHIPAQAAGMVERAAIQAALQISQEQVVAVQAVILETEGEEQTHKEIRLLKREREEPAAAAVEVGYTAVVQAAAVVA